MLAFHARKQKQVKQPIDYAIITLASVSRTLIYKVLAFDAANQKQIIVAVDCDPMTSAVNMKRMCTVLAFHVSKQKQIHNSLYNLTL